VLVVYMFPPILLAIPLYLLVIDWHLADTRWALILTYIANALPSSLWLLRALGSYLLRQRHGQHSPTDSLHLHPAIPHCSVGNWGSEVCRLTGKIEQVS